MASPFLIDAHSHINFSAYKDDAPEVIRRADDAGVWMLAVGSQIDTSRRAVEYAERYEHVWAVVGLHPIHLVNSQVDLEEVGEEGKRGVAFRTRSETFDVVAYRSLAAHPRVVAIGECGLDYYRMSSSVTALSSFALSRESANEPKSMSVQETVRRLQEATFRQHISLAQELSLPLMVHVRDGVTNRESGTNQTNVTNCTHVMAAHEETLRILEETRNGWRFEPPLGMIHCYSGTWDEAQRYLALDFDIGFTGVITFQPRKSQLPLAEKICQTVREIPIDRFHVETDCPYLAPEPHRGERNEPRFVVHVAEKVAELKSMTLDEIARASTMNTVRLFRKISAS